MPREHHDQNRSKASKRRHNSEEDEDFNKRKRTEKNDTGTAKDSKNSGASTSGKSPSKDSRSRKTPASNRLQKIREGFKRNVLKIGNKDSSENSQGSGGNSKKPEETKPVDAKQESTFTRYQSKDSDNISKNVDKEIKNIPKKIPGSSNSRRSNEVIIINSSTDTSTDSGRSKHSPKKTHSQQNISGKHVPDSNWKSKSVETLADRKKNKEKTTSQSPMNQRMSRIRKASNSGGSSIKTKILNVSEKIQAGEMASILHPLSGKAKSFKIPLKINKFTTQISDTAENVTTSGDSKVKTDFFKETSRNNPTLSSSYSRETNIFATNNNDKGSPNKMHGLMETPTLKPISTPNTNIFATNKIKDIKSSEFNFESKRSLSPKENMQSKNTNIFATEALGNNSKNPTLTSACSRETNIFASNNNDKGSLNKMHGLMATPTRKSVSTNIFASNKINDIKSPEFNFESKRCSSPKEHVQNTNIFATEALGDNNKTNNSVDLSLEIIDEITSPCAFKTPTNHNSSSETVVHKSKSLGDRLKKIRGQLQDTEANKSADDSIGFVSQMSFDEFYKNPQPNCSRSAEVENWMESIHPTPNLTDQSVSDSMLVNFDNTLLEKSELLADSREDNSMEWDSIPDVAPRRFPNDSSTIEENQKEKAICVVADTNIFMNDLDRVETILNLKLPGDKKLIIYVPWMVLGELDNLKEARSNFFKSFTTQKALKGQRFINKHLAQSNSKIICQSVNEVCQQLDLGKSPDDKILACCLQVQNKYETVIMLTGDINLRNKGLANQVKSYPPSEIVERLENSKFFKIKVLSQEVLSDVISRCCWNVYGEAIHHMKALQVGRWDFEDCIARLKQYWQPVFSQLLLKHCLKTIEELAKLARRGKEIETNPKEFMNFVNKVKELLFYLQDIDHVNSVVKQLRNNIDEIVKAPKEF